MTAAPCGGLVNWTTSETHASAVGAPDVCHPGTGIDSRLGSPHAKPLCDAKILYTNMLSVIDAALP